MQRTNKEEKLRRLLKLFERKKIKNIIIKRRSSVISNTALNVNMAETEEENPFQHFPFYSLNDPDYSVLKHRLNSFRDWPRHRSQTPLLLATAGFYLINLCRGLVKCFSCGIELRDWEPGDVAMYEHEKFAPYCPFIIEERVKRAKRLGTEDLTPFIRALDSANTNDLVNHGEELLVKIRCKICFTKAANTLLLPCAHLAMCSDCCSCIQPCNAKYPYNRKCPVCRSPYLNQIQVYL